MKRVLNPLDFLLICLAGWLNQRERTINEFLRAENRILREQLGKKRLRLTDDQRRRLAALGKALGRKTLQQWASIVTPDTIMRWYHKLIAMKWDFSAKRGPGRPPVILFYLSGQDKAPGVRAGLICYFAITQLVALTSYLAYGLLDVRVGLGAAILTPAFLAGTLAGTRLFGRIDDRLFRRLTLLFLAIVAIAGLLK